MARALRVSFAGGLFHITSRGNNREKIFLDAADFEKYKALLARYRTRYSFKLYAYALMPNHVHLLIEPSTTASISKIMHGINTSYAQHFNQRHDHVGHVWQGRFHSSIVDSENYFLEVMRYMDLNPVRAGIARRPDGYDWHSYGSYAHGRREDALDQHELYLNLGDSRQKRQRAYREFVEARMEGGPGERDSVPGASAFISGADFESRIVKAYGQKIWPTYRRLLSRLHELRCAGLDQ